MKVSVHKECGRLVYYRQSMSKVFWDEHWQVHDTPLFYAPYLKGHVGRGCLPKVFNRWLPRNGRILETGCGKAQNVVALRARGYDCVGVDNAEKTINIVRGLFPEIPVVCGDICRLPWEDKSFAAYISLGVVEHFQEGPSRALREARRVLKDDGVLLVSVPHIFPWRLREVNRLPLTEEYSFYQYAFSPEEFTGLLSEEGFSVDQQYGYGSIYGIQLRYPRLDRILKGFPRVSAGLSMVLDATPVNTLLCRMRLYVARKTG